VPEVLDRIRQEMSARLAELRPLMDEHTRLEAALQALSDGRGHTPVPAPPVSAGQPKLRAGKATPAGARKRAPAAQIAWSSLKLLRTGPAPPAQSWPRPPVFSATP
jgi:hypothetical protein